MASWYLIPQWASCISSLRLCSHTDMVRLPHRYHPFVFSTERSRCSVDVGSVLRSGFWPFWPFFWARTLPWKIPITIEVLEHKILEFFRSFRTEKDGTNPENLCSNTPIVMGIFHDNVLAQKKGQKGQKPDLKTLDVGWHNRSLGKEMRR